MQETLFILRRFYSLFTAYCFFIISVTCLNAQTLISFTPPDPIVICQEGEYVLTLGSSEEVLEIVLVLPDGFMYHPGKIFRGEELNVSDSTRPEFRLQNEGNDQFTLGIRLTPECDVYDLLNQGTAFSFVIETNGNRIELPRQDVQTPFLVNGSLPRLLLQSGQTASLPVTVKNTRQGYLTGAILELGLSTQIGVTPPGPEWNLIADSIWILEVDSAVLSQFGNRDKFWDPDEELIFNFDLSFSGCLTRIVDIPVYFRSEWGCDRSCQEDLETGVISLSSGMNQDPRIEMKIDTIWDPCFCREAPSRVCITLVNTSPFDARDIDYYWVGTDENWITFIDTNFQFFPASKRAGTQIFDENLGGSHPDSITSIRLSIPLLEGGDSIRWCMDVYSGDLIGFPIKFMGFANRLSYRSACPPYRPFGIPLFKVTGPAIGVNASTIFNISRTLVDGQIAEGFLQIQGMHPDFKRGILDISMAVPCGIEIVDSSFLLNGLEPSRKLRSGNVWSLTYEGDFSADPLTIPFSIRFSCDSITECATVDGCLKEWVSPIPGCPDNDPVFATFFCTEVFHLPCSKGVSQSGCGPFSSPQNGLPFECDTIPSCPDTVDQYWLGDLGFERTSLGWVDEDNDRIGDRREKTDPQAGYRDQLRLDRIVSGDTFRIRFDGTFFSDDPLSDSLEWHIFFTGGGNFPDGENPNFTNFNGFVDSENLQIVEARILCEDASGRLRLDAELPSADRIGSRPKTLCGEVTLGSRIANEGTIIFRLGRTWLEEQSLNGFSFEPGDKLTLSVLIHQSFNPQAPQEIINFSAGDLVYAGNEEQLVNFSPGCRTASFQLLRTNANSVAERRWQDGCRQGNTRRMFVFQMNPAMSNAFPYEYRNFYLPDTVRMPRLFNIAIGRADWVLYHRDGFVEREFRRFPASYTFEPDDVVFTMPESDSLWWDENVLTVLDMDYNLELCLPSQDSIISSAWDANVKITDGHYIWKNLDDTLLTERVDWFLPVNIRSARVELDWQIANRLATPENDTTDWNFTLGFKNLEPGMVIGFELSNDRFEWLSVTEGGNELGERISDLLYQYEPDTSRSSLSGRIWLRQLSCVPDSVWLRYGFRCPFESELCVLDSFLLFSRPQGVEFEMIVSGPANEVMLCEPFDYHEIWFYNADRGAAFDPEIEAQLPPGLEYVTGSSEYRVNGQPDWVSGPDPVGTTDLVIWKLSEVLTRNSLSSVDRAPDNEVWLRFKTRPVCGFISGDQIRFQGRGYDPCGSLANRITRFGPDLKVNTNIPARNLAIEWAGSDTAYICRENSMLSWILDFPEGTIAGDSLWIYLPEGIIPGNANWNPGGQAVYKTETFSNRTRLLLDIPPGYDQLRLDLEASFSSSLPCGELDILAQAVTSENIFCGNDTIPCPVYQVLASENTRLVISQEEIDLVSGDLLRNASGELEIFFTVSKGNKSAPTDLVACLVIDNPPTGLLDAGDEQRYSFSIPGSSWVGDTIQGSVVIPDSVKNKGCSLSLLLKASENCICDDQLIPLNISEKIISRDTLCPGEIWRIGVDSTAGLSYTWTGNNIDCRDCAHRSLVADPGIPERMEVLEVVDGQGCRTRYEFGLFTLPELSDLPNDTLVCAGQTYAFFTPAGYSGSWSGPGVTDPQNEVQLLQFDSAGVLYFRGTRTDGCLVEDTILVRVIAPPTVRIDTEVICSGEVPLLHAEATGSISEYQWFPVNAFINSGINPAELRSGQRPERVEIFVTDSAGCVAGDSARIRYSDFMFSEDTIRYRLCEGDSIQLEADSLMDIRWISTTGLSCDTCRQVVWVPWDRGELFQIGSDSLGCADTIVHTARLIPDIRITTPLLFCEGDSVRIEDTVVTTAGMYFYTFTTAEGCDSIRVYDVSSFPVDTPLIEGPELVLLGDTVRWRVAGGSGYAWSGPFGYIDCPDCPEIFFTVVDSGYITLRYLTPDGCELVLRRKINYYEIDCPEADRVFVPNAFSPNGDGVNDILMVRGTGDAELFFMIYNRWGQEVFRTRDPNYGWDGAFNGALLEPDTYSYYLELRCPGGEPIRKKGNVTIFK